MKSKISKHFDKLSFIASIRNPNLRSKILSDIANDDLYKALNEIALNYQNGNIVLNSKQKNQIKKYKRLLQRLTIKSNNSTVKKKLIQQSGGFLPILIPTIASIITSLIAS